MLGQIALKMPDRYLFFSWYILDELKAFDTQDVLGRLGTVGGPKPILYVFPQPC